MKRAVAHLLYPLTILLVVTNVFSGNSFMREAQAQEGDSDLPKIVAQAELPLAENSKDITLAKLNLLLDNSGRTLYYARNHYGGFSEQGQATQSSNLVSIDTSTLQQSNQTEPIEEFIDSSAINTKTGEIFVGTTKGYSVFDATSAVKKFVPGGPENTFSQATTPKGGFVRDILLNANANRAYVLTSAAAGPEGGVGTVLSVFDASSLALVTAVEPSGTWADLKTDEQGKLYVQEDVNIAILQGLPHDYKDYVQIINERTLQIEKRAEFNFEILDLEVEGATKKLFLVAQKPDNSLWLITLSETLSVEGEIKIKGASEKNYLSGDIELNPKIGRIYFWEPALDADPGMTIIDYTQNRILGVINEGVVDIAVDTNTSRIYAVTVSLNKQTNQLDAKIVVLQDIEPSVSQIDVQNLLQQKQSLINDLKSFDIPTSLFPIMDVPAYNEEAAQNLLDRTSDQLQQGRLTPEQLDAFARLTLQEDALSKMLPAYTNVAGSFVATGSSTVETSLGALFGLRPVWDKCRPVIPFCGRLQEATEGTLWRLISSSGVLFSNLFFQSPEDRELGGETWSKLTSLTEASLKKGDSLKQLVADTSAEAAGTGLLIKGYLNRTQKLLDKGVRTADLEAKDSDRWPITGDMKRANVVVNQLTDEADLESKQALDVYQQFEKGANILQVAEDVSDLATLTPAIAMAKAVGIGARIEHLAVNAWAIGWNRDALPCIEYLSTRAAEKAFNSEQLFDTCRQRNGFRPSDGQIVLVSNHSARFNSPLQSQLQSETNEYRQAVQALVQAVQARDDQAIERAVMRVSASEKTLGSTLDKMQAILFAQKTLTQSDLALFSKNSAFITGNFALYLTVAETLMAQHEGTQPQQDIQQVAQAALINVENLQQASAQVNVTPPADKPIAVIQSVQAEITPDQHMQVDVQVSNVGGADTPDLKLVLLVEDKSVSEPIMLGPLGAGKDTQTMLTVPLPTAASFTLQLLSQNVVVDTRLAGVPLSKPVPTTTEIALAPTSAQPQPTAANNPVAELSGTPVAVPLTATQSSQGNIGLFAVGVGVIILLTLVLVWVRLRKKSGA